MALFIAGNIIRMIGTDINEKSVQLGLYRAILYVANIKEKPNSWSSIGYFMQKKYIRLLLFVFSYSFILS